MIYHGTFISDGNNHFNGKCEISVPMEQIFRGSKYFVAGALRSQLGLVWNQFQLGCIGDNNAQSRTRHTISIKN